LPWAATSFNVNVPIMAGTKDEGNNFHWGEYAATVLDSTNGLTFYGVGEYFTTGQSGRSNCGSPSSNCYTWRTRIFRHQE